MKCKQRARFENTPASKINLRTNSEKAGISLYCLKHPHMCHTDRLFRILVGCCLAMAIFSGCATQEKRVFSNDHRDTTVKVYGPYRAVKLPLSKGVKMGNPIQLALGPGGLMYAANQTGEVYTLRDSDGDGLEDSTALYCNVEDFGLRSPAGFAHKVTRFLSALPNRSALLSMRTKTAKRIPAGLFSIISPRVNIPTNGPAD
jgi:hypothetical protein